MCVCVCVCVMEEVRKIKFAGGRRYRGICSGVWGVRLDLVQIAFGS